LALLGMLAAAGSGYCGEDVGIKGRMKIGLPLTQTPFSTPSVPPASRGTPRHAVSMDLPTAGGGGKSGSGGQGAMLLRKGDSEGFKIVGEKIIGNGLRPAQPALWRRGASAGGCVRRALPVQSHPLERGKDVLGAADVRSRLFVRRDIWRGVRGDARGRAEARGEAGAAGRALPQPRALCDARTAAPELRRAAELLLHLAPRGPLRHLSQPRLRPAPPAPRRVAARRAAHQASF